MIFNYELNIYLMKLNVLKHLIVCSVLAPSNTTNSSIQTSIIKLNVDLYGYYLFRKLPIGEIYFGFKSLVIIMDPHEVISNVSQLVRGMFCFSIYH